MNTAIQNQINELNRQVQAANRNGDSNKASQINQHIISLYDQLELDRRTQELLLGHIVQPSVYTHYVIDR